MSLMKNLLSIDDDPTVLDIIQFTLARDGWCVYTAMDGREGVKKAIARLPNIILSDISMPNFDGFETLRAIRSHPLTKHIPFIFMTATPDSVIRQQAIRYGVKYIIVKPFNPLSLNS